MNTKCIKTLSFVYQHNCNYNDLKWVHRELLMASVNKRLRILFKGEWYPKPSFVHYLKIINTNLKNNISILEQIVWGTFNGIRMLVGQVVLELLIKMVFCMFWSVSKDAPGLLKSLSKFLSSPDNFLQDIVFQKSVENCEIAHKTCSILVWDALPS